jgi:hypothetical protein
MIDTLDWPNQTNPQWQNTASTRTTSSDYKTRNFSPQKTGYSDRLIREAIEIDMYDIYHYCVYTENLLMMDKGIVRNM